VSFSPAEASLARPRPAWLWALPLAILVHNLEEYPRIVDYAGRHGIRVSRREMGFAVAFATLLPLPITVLAAARPADLRRRKLVLALAAGMAANGVSHGLQTLVFRDYSPGTVTGVGVLLPLVFWLFREAGLDGIVPEGELRRAATLGVALMAPTALVLRAAGAALDRTLARRGL
jgi:hypothetical protein